MTERARNLFRQSVQPGVQRARNARRVFYSVHSVHAPEHQQAGGYRTRTNSQGKAD
jgi:hypothetical protein